MSQTKTISDKSVSGSIRRIREGSIPIRFCSRSELGRIAETGLIEAGREFTIHGGDILARAAGAGEWGWSAYSITRSNLLSDGLDFRRWVSFMLEGKRKEGLRGSEFYSAAQKGIVEEMRSNEYDCGYFIETLSKVLETVPASGRFGFVRSLLAGETRAFEKAVEDNPDTHPDGIYDKYGRPPFPIRFSSERLTARERDQIANILTNEKYLVENSGRMRDILHTLGKLMNVGSARHAVFGRGSGKNYLEGYEVLLLCSKTLPLKGLFDVSSLVDTSPLGDTLIAKRYRESHPPEYSPDSILETTGDSQASEHLLGVICILTDRAALKTVVGTVSGEDSKIRVPVFDSRGILRWPKPKRQRPHATVE